MTCVEVGPLPEWVEISRTSFNGAFAVLCHRCQSINVIYTVLLLKKPHLLQAAVDEHTGCGVESSPQFLS